MMRILGIGFLIAAFYTFYVLGYLYVGGVLLGFGFTFLILPFELSGTGVSDSDKATPRYKLEQIGSTITLTFVSFIIAATITWLLSLVEIGGEKYSRIVEMKNLNSSLDSEINEAMLDDKISIIEYNKLSYIYDSFQEFVAKEKLRE